MIWFEATRPKTLPISIAPVILGTLLAPHIYWGTFILTLICALSIQIGTNFANDYFDHKYGSDTKERRGPRRLIGAGKISEASMLHAVIVTWGVAVFTGIILTFIGGLIILVLLVLALAAGFWYSAGHHSLSRMGLADIFVFVFFGPIAVCSTYYLQIGMLVPALIWPSLAAGLIPVAVLAVNNLRDEKEDHKHDKHTLVVRFGYAFGQWEYTLCLLGGILSALPLAFYHPYFLITQLTLLPAIWLIKRIWLYKQPAKIAPVLGNTGKLLIAYVVLYVIGALL